MMTLQHSEVLLVTEGKLLPHFRHDYSKFPDSVEGEESRQLNTWIWNSEKGSGQRHGFLNVRHIRCY